MKCIAVLAVVCAGGLSAAQPVQVIVRSDGSAELSQRDGSDLGDSVKNPEYVPVFTEQDDGSLVPGITYRGISQSGHHYMDYPGAVVRLRDGTYEVEMYTWSVIHGRVPSFDPEGEGGSWAVGETSFTLRDKGGHRAFGAGCPYDQLAR